MSIETIFIEDNNHETPMDKRIDKDLMFILSIFIVQKKQKILKQYQRYK